MHETKVPIFQNKASESEKNLDSSKVTVPNNGKNDDDDIDIDSVKSNNVPEGHKHG